MLSKAQPNAAHRLLVQLENRLGDDLLLVTTNIDSLHREARNKRLLEVHGNVWA